MSSFVRKKMGGVLSCQANCTTCTLAIVIKDFVRTTAATISQAKDASIVNRSTVHISADIIEVPRQGDLPNHFMIEQDLRFVSASFIIILIDQFIV